MNKVDISKFFEYMRLPKNEGKLHGSYDLSIHKNKTCKVELMEPELSINDIKQTLGFRFFKCDDDGIFLEWLPQTFSFNGTVSGLNLELLKKEYGRLFYLSFFEDIATQKVIEFQENTCMCCGKKVKDQS